MAEIIGVVSAIIAVAETSLRIIQQIDKVRRHFLYSFKQIPEARDKISLITTSLKSVKSTRSLQTPTVSQRVNQIQEVLQELNDFLEHLRNHSKGIKDRLKNVLNGPKKEKRLSQLLERLDVLIPYLHIDISVAQFGPHEAAEAAEPGAEPPPAPPKDKMEPHHQLTTTTTTTTIAARPASRPPAVARANESRQMVRPGTLGSERPMAARPKENMPYIPPKQRQYLESDVMVENEPSSPMSDTSTLVEESISPVKETRPCYGQDGAVFRDNKGGKDNVMISGNLGNVRSLMRPNKAVFHGNEFGEASFIVHGNIGADVCSTLFARRRLEG